MTSSLAHNQSGSELTAEQIVELQNLRTQIDAMLPVDIKASKAEIKERLRAIRAAVPKDSEVYVSASEMWQYVQGIAASAETAAGIAAGNALATQTAQDQRNELLRAIDRQDSEHPEVAALIAGVQEETEYTVVMREQDASRQECFEIAAAHLEKEYGLHEDTAKRLACDMVKGYTGWGYTPISADQRAAIGDAIAAILEDWRTS